MSRSYPSASALLAALLVAAAHAVGAPTVLPWGDLGSENAREITVGGPEGLVLLMRRENADPLRSTDGGASFAPFTVQGSRPGRFYSSPAGANLFYALQGNFLDGGAASSANPARLHRSTDAGKTWTLVNGQLAAGSDPLGNLRPGAAQGLIYASRMEASMCFINCFYAGSEPFRSRDGGASWQSILNGLPAPLGDVVLAPAPSNPGVVYVSTSVGIFRSDDQGDQWRKVREWSAGEAILQVLVDHADPNVVYAKYWAYPVNTLMRVTEDGGATWREVQFHVGGPNRRLVADPIISGRLFLVGGGGEVAESRDRGRTWNRVALASDRVLLDEASGDDSGRLGIAVRGESRVLYAPHHGTGLQQVEVRPDALSLGSDMWWNPSESGTGWSISQHESGQVFAVWYDYDAAGKQAWRVIPSGTWTDARTFAGTVYSTTGPDYFGSAFDPSKVSTQAVGTVTLRFDDSENAVVSYSISGVAGEKRITRQLYGNPVHDRFRPQNYADLWWNPAESGWGMAFSQQYSTAFAVLFVYDEQQRPLWVVMPAGRLGWERIGQTSAWNFFGDIYTTTGPAFGEPFDTSKVTVTRAGAASIAFVDQDNAVLTYDAFGRQAKRQLKRQSF